MVNRKTKLRKKSTKPKATRPSVPRKGEDNTIRNLLSALGILLLIAFVVQAVRDRGNVSSSGSTSTYSSYSAPSTTSNSTTTSSPVRKKVTTTSYPVNAFPPLVEYVRGNMNNPASFEHISTTKEKTGNSQSIAMVYRERTVGGSLLTKKVKAFVTPDGSILSVEYE